MGLLRARSDPHLPRAAAPFQRQLDWLMLAVVCLCCLGLVMAVSVQSFRPGASALLAMKSQGAKLVAGLVAFLVCAVAPIEALRRLARPLFALGAVLVFAAALFGPEWNGARRWLSIGSQSFQPVDFARLCMLVATAALLADAGPRVREFWRGFLVVMSPALILAAGLVLQPDHGNALMCLTLAVALGLAAGVSVRWFVVAALPLIPALAFVVLSRDYVVVRVARFLSDEPSLQVRQSLLAIRSGGLTGQGVGNGWMKMGFVPEAHSDFVFAIVGEELGFLGSAAVLGLFTLIGVVGLRLVVQLHDPFYRYVVFGCTLAICTQAMINMLVATGMAPAKGIDLPFVSAGGTNLMASLAAVGLIGNAARADFAEHGGRGGRGGPSGGRGRW